MWRLNITQLQCEPGFRLICLLCECSGHSLAITYNCLTLPRAFCQRKIWDFCTYVWSVTSFWIFFFSNLLCVYIILLGYSGQLHNATVWLLLSLYSDTLIQTIAWILWSFDVTSFECLLKDCFRFHGQLLEQLLLPYCLPYWLFTLFCICHILYCVQTKWWWQCRKSSFWPMSGYLVTATSNDDVSHYVSSTLTTNRSYFAGLIYTAAQIIKGGNRSNCNCI